MPLGIPVKAISGNHDEPELVAQTFDLEAELHEGELFYSRSDTPMGILYFGYDH